MVERRPAVGNREIRWEYNAAAGFWYDYDKPLEEIRWRKLPMLLRKWKWNSFWSANRIETCLWVGGVYCFSILIFRFLVIAFLPSQKMKIVNIELGDPYKEACTAPESVPPARVFWIYMGAGRGGSMTAFNSINSSYISMNDKVIILVLFNFIDLTRDLL